MPRTGKIVSDPTLLEAALQGLELQKQKIEQQIQQVRELLRKNGGGIRASSVLETQHSPQRAPRQLSPEARKRIAAAQKRRWSEFRKAAAKKHG